MSNVPSSPGSTKPARFAMTPGPDDNKILELESKVKYLENIINNFNLMLPTWLGTQNKKDPNLISFEEDLKPMHVKDIKPPAENSGKR